MTPPLLRYIPDVLEEHFEELDHLWNVRHQSMSAPDQTVRHVAELDERIAAHIEGLRVAGEAAVAMAAESLGETERSTVFAAVYTLLRVDSELGRQTLIDAIARISDPAALDGLRDALCYGPIAVLESDLQLLVEGEGAVAAVAAEALAVHGILADPKVVIARLIGSEDPWIQAAAWRIAAISQVVPSSE